ncbi:MAG: hypothetical protein VKI83_00785 [Synechococcaceae cyanobacterium]|nr:hypothetical protein [Synechococcaceae cyanobacterium]
MLQLNDDLLAATSRLARRAVRSLADTPRPPNGVALQGETGVDREHVEDHRLVDEVLDRVRVVPVSRS